MFTPMLSPSEDIYHSNRDTLESEWGVIKNYAMTVGTSQACPRQTRCDHPNRGGRGWLMAGTGRHGDDAGGMRLKKVPGKKNGRRQRGDRQKRRSQERAEKCGGSGLTR